VAEMSRDSKVNDDTSSEFEPFWRSLQDGRLSFPRCEHCGRFHWYPKTACPFCGSSLLNWTPISGEGDLYSWTVVRHAFTDDYRSKIPYVVALVEFDEAPGIRLVSNLIVNDVDAIEFGMRVLPDFSKSKDEPPRVLFAPAR